MTHTERVNMNIPRPAKLAKNVFIKTCNINLILACMHVNTFTLLTLLLVIWLVKIGNFDLYLVRSRRLEKNSRYCIILNICLYIVLNDAKSTYIVQLLRISATTTLIGYQRSVYECRKDANHGRWYTCPPT